MYISHEKLGFSIFHVSILVFGGCMLNYIGNYEFPFPRLGCVSFVEGQFLQVLPSVPRLGKHCQDGAHEDAGWLSAVDVEVCRILFFFLYFCGKLIHFWKVLFFFFCFLGWIWMNTIDILRITMYSILVTLRESNFDFNQQGFDEDFQLTAWKKSRPPQLRSQRGLCKNNFSDNARWELMETSRRAEVGKSTFSQVTLSLDQLKLKWMFLRFQNHFSISPINMWISCVFKSCVRCVRVGGTQQNVHISRSLQDVSKLSMASSLQSHCQLSLIRFLVVLVRRKCCNRIHCPDSILQHTIIPPPCSLPKPYEMYLSLTGNCLQRNHQHYPSIIQNIHIVSYNLV